MNKPEENKTNKRINVSDDMPLLDAMINALALTNENYWFYLDRKTMKVVKNRSVVDDMDATYLAHAYPDRFLPLPDKRQIHTYAIMEAYALNAAPPASQRLHAALQGAGPFKRFKDEAKKLGLEEDWLVYRDERFRQMALEWCASHGIVIDPETREAVAADNAPDKKPAEPRKPRSSRQTPDSPEQIIRGTAAAIAHSGAAESSLAVGLIESIRLLFRLLDDASFEAALDHLSAAIQELPV